MPPRPGPPQGHRDCPLSTHARAETADRLSPCGNHVAVASTTLGPFVRQAVRARPPRQKTAFLSGNLCCGSTSPEATRSRKPVDDKGGQRIASARPRSGDDKGRGRRPAYVRNGRPQDRVEANSFASAALAGGGEASGPSAGVLVRVCSSRSACGRPDARRRGCQRGPHPAAGPRLFTLGRRWIKRSTSPHVVAAGLAPLIEARVGVRCAAAPRALT